MKPQHLWHSLRTRGRLSSQVRDACLHVALTRFSNRSDPFAAAYQRVHPYTMSGPARLRGLYDAVRGVIARGIPGDIVECGTARGGSAALMALAARDGGERRTVWAFDTFEGIPPPTTADPDYDVARHYTGSFRGELAEVEALFATLAIEPRPRLIKGLFEETLPRTDVGTIAVLHIDGDWYHSVKVCLEQLFDRVAPGGIVQIDDYGHWAGARKAVDEFLHARRLDVPLRVLDYTGRQLTKP